FGSRAFQASKTLRAIYRFSWSLLLASHTGTESVRYGRTPKIPAEPAALSRTLLLPRPEASRHLPPPESGSWGFGRQHYAFAHSGHTSRPSSWATSWIGHRTIRTPPGVARPA